MAQSRAADQEIPGYSNDTPAGDTGNASPGGPSSTSWKGPSSTTHSPTSSLWGKNYASRANLQQSRYADTANGGYIALRDRLASFRAAVNAGTTTPSLDTILDYYIDFTARHRLSDGPPHGITIQQYLDKVRHYSKAALQTLQEQLRDAGFYTADIYGGKRKVQGGVYDDPTRQALNTAITEMIAGGSGAHTIGDFLKQKADEVAANGGPLATTGAASVIHLTNPLDIQRTYRTVAQELTGKEHAGEVGSAVGGYQAQQLSSGNAEIAATGVDGAPGPGGGVGDPASVQAYAEAQLRQNSGPEVAAHSALGIYNALLQRVGLAG